MLPVALATSLLLQQSTGLLDAQGINRYYLGASPVLPNVIF